MKFYKSFLFLFILNSLFIGLASFFLSLHFFIPLFVFLLVLNVYLLFFTPYNLKKSFEFSAFAPEDPFQLHASFKALKKEYDLKNIQLLKVKSEEPLFFFFSGGRRSFVAFSETFLQTFSKKDIKCFLSYPFVMAKSQDLLFLSLLSRFLFLTQKISYFLSYPLLIFFKSARLKKQDKESLLLALMLKILYFWTKKIFFKADKAISKHTNPQTNPQTNSHTNPQTNSQTNPQNNSQNNSTKQLTKQPTKQLTNQSADTTASPLFMEVREPSPGKIPKNSPFFSPTFFNKPLDKFVF